MWAAQYYAYKRPRQWLSSAGLGAMGFGLPAAAAVGNPGVTVVDIDGDGSFLMNVEEELAMICTEKLPVKIMVLNNQHLGVVVQWEDRFYKANRAHTYLGDPKNEEEIYTDLVAIAKGLQCTWCSGDEEEPSQGGYKGDAGDYKSLLIGCHCATLGACATYDPKWRRI